MYGSDCLIGFDIKFTLQQLLTLSDGTLLILAMIVLSISADSWR
jgi:hypothetical protein